MHSKRNRDPRRLPPDPDGNFEPLPPPGPGDWLAEHYEPGQTFEQYVQSVPNVPDQVRNRVVLRPLGTFREGASVPPDLLRRCAEAYFSMPVDLLPAPDLADLRCTTRVHPHTGKIQVLTTDVLDYQKKRLPPDAFCVLAVTMEDLYPAPSWNFVFGQASIRARVGVCSFARYDPAFYGAARDGAYYERLVRRGLKVLVHEIAHMFSLAHCVFFKCALNGSNHLEESDARPLFLCPVCLEKLRHALGFDVTERYGRLLEFCRQAGLEKEARWLERRLRGLRGVPEARPSGI